VIAGSNSGWYEFGRHSVHGWVIAPSVLVPSDGVWSFRPSSPVRLPHLKCLFVCKVLEEFLRWLSQ
jgi:hypothetical protein